MGILKACPRCRGIIPHGMAYCPACAPIAQAEREAKQARRLEYLTKQYNRKYNRQRAADDPRYRQFRNSKQWRTLSRAKLQACGYKCEARLDGCQRIACEVHHKKPIRTPDGWESRYDWDGLQGVCVACHNKLDGKTGGKKKENDGYIVDLRGILPGK